MPIPTPKKEETQDDFIERCMSNDIMKKEYDDNDQRLAVCFSQWKKKEKKSMREPQIERREIPLSEFRVQRKDDEPLRFTGYAARFNSLSEDLGGFKEKIAPGAFRDTIEKADIRALFNHDSNYVLGRTKAGTLILEEDEKGLRIDNEPPNATWAKDLAVSIERGDISQMSFGFRTVQESWNEEGKIPIRTLEIVDLIDVSIVTFPAYKSTKVQTRELMERNDINVDAISRVLVKKEHDLEINESDRAEISEVVNKLNKLLPEDETVQQKEPPEDEIIQNEALLREKKLLLKQKKMIMEDK